MPKNDLPLPDLVDIPLVNGFFLLGAEAGGAASLFDDEVGDVDEEAAVTGPDARERPAPAFAVGTWKPAPLVLLLGGLPTPSVALPYFSPLDLLGPAVEMALGACDVLATPPMPLTLSASLGNA